MALKPFNTVGGLSVGGNLANVIISTNSGDSNVGNYAFNTTGYGNVTLGNVSNLHISGGTSGQYLQTDGSGTLTWANAGNATALINGNSNVIVTANGNVTTSVAGNSGIQVVTGTGVNVSGYLTATGNIAGNNFTTGANAAVNFIANGFQTAIVAKSTLAANYTLTLPADDGNSGQVLSTDGSGVLSWANVSGSSITNGNSNVVVAANANVTIGSNGVADVVTVTNGNVITGNGVGIILTSNNGTAIRQVQLKTSTDAGFTANYSLTLPVDDGTSGQALTTDGSGILTWSTIGTGSLSNGNSNVVVLGNANITFSSNGNANIMVVTSSGDGNLQTTGVNVAGYITSSANITAANLVGPLANGNSRIAITSNANVVTTANGNAVTTVTSSGDGNLQTTGVNVAGYINASGNIVGANLVGVFANGNSNVAIAAANGNVTISSAGNSAIVTVTGTGANIAGTANITGNTAIGGNANVAGTANLVGDVLAGANVNVTSNINGATFQNGNSSVKIAANSVVTLSANGQANIINVYSNGTHATTTVANDILITGNITVQGNTNYINVETYVVEDPIIELGSGPNGTTPVENAFDSGILLKANTASEGAINRFMGWDTSNAEFGFSGNASDSSNVITFNNYANVRALNFIGKLANGNSNVAITSNANVVVTANGNAVITVTSSGDGNLQTTGGNVTGYWNVSGNALAANFVGTLANGNSNVRIASNANVTLTANGNLVTTWTSNGDGNLALIGSNTVGYVSASGNIVAIGNVYSNNNVRLEGAVQFSSNYESAADSTNHFSNIGANTLTTTSTSGAAISVVPSANGRAVEFMVKGIDSAGSKFYAATILALAGNTANGDLDYSTYAVQQIGTSPGALAVALTDGNANITLQVTPASTNSTVWTTQWRTI